MELRLPLFFNSKNSTIVRSLIEITRERLAFRLMTPMAPRRAVKRAHRLFLTPPRHRFTEAELIALEEASLFNVPLPTGKLVGWRWGPMNGPKVLLAHGWGGRGAQMRSFVAPLLSRGYTVLTYDAPGHGMTGGRESSFVHMAAAMEAVLEQVGSVEAVVAHSIGGAVAGYVLGRGARAKAAVLLAPPASMTEYSYRFARILRLPEHVRALMQADIERRFGVPWSEFEVEKTAPRLTQPALIVHDANDADNFFRDGERYARHWAGARLLRTEGLGHRGVLRDPKVVHEAVTFIDGATGR